MTSIRATNSNRPRSSSSRSPPLETGRRRTPTPTTAAAPTPSILPPTSMMVTVKREETGTATTANEEIKEFAETAMNELLGLYGYGAPENAAASKRPGTGGMATMNGSAMDFRRDISPRFRPNNRTGRGNDQHRESPSQSPHSLSNSPSRISPIATPTTDSNIVRPSPSCEWCHRKINRDAETYGTTEGVRFCSEPCFAQSRRATFKRAKTCDWCRHVRHAVSYVDFQDGASQLQFCSDKCLNQYKMQIFIKETQAHLEMNPHLLEKGEGSGTNLITPELWLKNCRSRSASPELSKSRSSSPDGNLHEASPSKMNHLEVSGPRSTATTTVIRPTITVAPVSKLLQAPSQPNHIDVMSTRPSMKTMRKQRRTLRNGPPVRDHPSTYSHRVIEDNAPGPTPTSNQARQCAINSGSPNTITVNHDSQKTARNHLGEQIIFDGRFLSPPPNLYPIRHPNMIPPPLFRPMDHQQQHHHHQQHHHLPPPPLPPLRPGGNYSENHHRAHPPEAQNYPASLMGHMPPVTILVPCPIIIPIPVPIPIPISMPEFLTRLLATTNDASRPSNPPESINPGNSNPHANDENNNHSSTGAERDYPLDLDLSNPSNTTDKNLSRDSARDLNGMDSDSELSENGGGSSTRSCEIVPKIKITRLQSKRILTSKELDSSRPLRKRKRIVVASYT